MGQKRYSKIIRFIRISEYQDFEYSKYPDNKIGRILQALVRIEVSRCTFG
jgi:hypothetical protein